MKWLSALLSIIDKLLPNREARLRNRIRKLKDEYSALQDDPWSPDHERRLDHIIDKLSDAEKKLQGQ